MEVIMLLKYEIGPARIWIGPINNQIEFQAGVPKEVDDELGDRLLQKKSIVFTKVEKEKME